MSSAARAFQDRGSLELRRNIYQANDARSPLLCYRFTLRIGIVTFHWQEFLGSWVFSRIPVRRKLLTLLRSLRIPADTQHDPWRDEVSISPGAKHLPIPPTIEWRSRLRYRHRFSLLRRGNGLLRGLFRRLVHYGFTNAKIEVTLFDCGVFRKSWKSRSFEKT